MTEPRRLRSRTVAPPEPAPKRRAPAAAPPAAAAAARPTKRRKRAAGEVVRLPRGEGRGDGAEAAVEGGGRKMTVLELPDDALLVLFDRLGAVDPRLSPPGRTSVVDCADGADLFYEPERDPRRIFSQTCRRLDAFFRERYSSRLFVRPRSNAVWQCLSRAVSRHPGVRVVEVVGIYPVGMRDGVHAKTDRGTRAMTRAVCAQRSAVKVVIMMEPWTMPARDARVFFETVCPNLAELQVNSAYDVAGIAGWDPMRQWVGSLPVTLTSLSLAGIGRSLSDRDGPSLAGLTRLRRLELTDCDCFGTQTFAAIERLPIEDLRYELAPRCRLVNMAVLEDTIGRMYKLKTLLIGISGDGLNSLNRLRLSFLRKLPVHIVSLSVGMQFDAQLPAGAFSHLPNLSHLSLLCDVGHWGTLSSLSPSLRNLHVHDGTLTDHGAELAFADPSFRGLTQLSLTCCMSTSDKIAQLVSELSELEHLNVSGTPWSDVAIAAAIAGTGAAQKRRLKVVDISGCEQAKIASATAAAALQHVEDLRMCRTSVGLDGIRELTKVTSFPQLRSLSISLFECCISDECDHAVSMFDRLKERPNFKSLSLTHFCALGFFAVLLDNLMWG